MLLVRVVLLTVLYLPLHSNYVDCGEWTSNSYLQRGMSWMHRHSSTKTQAATVSSSSSSSVPLKHAR